VRVNSGRHDMSAANHRSITEQLRAGRQARVACVVCRRTADTTIQVTSIFTSPQHITHTHPFNGHLSGTTRVSRYQNGKTNLDFTEATDSEWQWHQQMAICKSAPSSRHRQTTTAAPNHSTVFYRLDALPAAQPTVSKH